MHVFSFLHKLNSENSFCFLSILGCQTSFLVSKIKNCFWKQKIRGKNSYQTYPTLFSNFFIKNGSYSTIYTFQNYYATIFFSFQFQFSTVSKRTLRCSFFFFFLRERIEKIRFRCSET